MCLHSSSKRGQVVKAVKEALQAKQHISFVRFHHNLKFVRYLHCMGSADGW